jgi:hypothetical protein
MLGNWNYRKCKQKKYDEYFGVEYDKYFIAEVYYNNEGQIVGWNDEFDNLKDNQSEESLKEDFDKMIKAFNEPILDLDVIEIIEIPIEETEDQFYNYNTIEI